MIAKREKCWSGINRSCLLKWKSLYNLTCQRVINHFILL